MRYVLRTQEELCSQIIASSWGFLCSLSSKSCSHFCQFDHANFYWEQSKQQHLLDLCVHSAYTEWMLVYFVSVYWMSVCSCEIQLQTFCGNENREVGLIQQYLMHSMGNIVTHFYELVFVVLSIDPIINSLSPEIAYSVSRQVKVLLPLCGLLKTKRVLWLQCILVWYLLYDQFLSKKCAMSFFFHCHCVKGESHFSPGLEVYEMLWNKSNLWKVRRIRLYVGLYVSRHGYQKHQCEVEAVLMFIS